MSKRDPFRTSLLATRQGRVIFDRHDEGRTAGWRRHALVKRHRDRRREDLKRLARLVLEGHDLPPRTGACSACGSPPDAEHRLKGGRA